MRQPYPPSYKLILIALLLVLLAIVSGIFLSDSSSDSLSYVKDINKKIDNELNGLILEQNLIEQAVLKDSIISFESLNQPFKHPFYLFKNEKIAYWSNNQIVPRYRDIGGDYYIKFLELQEGQFVVRKQIIQKDSTVYELFSMLPIYRSSQIDNRYLKSGINERLFQNSNVKIEFRPDVASNQIKAFDSTYLFSVDLTEDYELSKGLVLYVIVILVFTAIAISCLYLFLWAQYLANKGRVEIGCTILVAGFLLIHAAILGLNFPFAFLEIDIFNPIYFTSTLYNPSLGNLLLNMIFLLVVIFYFFNHYYRSRSFKRMLNMSQIGKTIASVVLVWISFYALFFEFLLLRTLYHDSQWSLDITTSIDFPFLKIICLAVFFIAGVIYFLVNHAIFKLFIRINRRSSIQLATNFGIGTAAYAITSHILGDPYIMVVILNTIYFIILKSYKLPRYLVNIRYKTFIYFFVSAFITSALGGFAIRGFEHDKMIDSKERYANQLLLKNDVLGEFLLSELIIKIKQDALIKSRLQSPFLSKDAIEKKVKQMYITSYFDKYDTRINVFNAKGDPYNTDRNLVNFNLLEFFYNEDRYKTDHDDIFFIDDFPNDISKQYISLIKFETSDHPTGHIIIEMKLKKIIPNSLYPQLLIDKRFTQPVLTKNYSYAVYDGEVLEENSGDFNYGKNFKYPRSYNSLLFEDGLIIDGYHHLGIQERGDKNIVISSQIKPFRTLVSNFSFLLMVFIFITIALFGAFMLITRSSIVKVNFGTRIQLYLNAAFFLPLLAVSISMLSLIGSSYDRDVTIQYFQKARIASNNLTSSLSRVLTQRLDRESLYNELSQLAKHAEVDFRR